MLTESAPLLHYQFIEQTIQPGQSVSLKCAAVGNPVPTLTWLLNGLPVQRSDRVLVGEQPGARGRVVGHVNITSSRVQDGGAYRCIASSSAGKVGHTANLNIYGEPTARHTASLTAVAGEALELYCPVAGYPLQSFLWTKDGVTLTGTEDNIRLGPGGTLTLKSARKPADSGLYSCSASVRQERSASAAVQVDVLTAPRIALVSTSDGGVEAGDRVTLTCTVSKGDSPLTIMWYRDGIPLPSHGSRTDDITIVSLNAYNSVLGVERVGPRHGGRYSCRASNAAGTDVLAYSLVVNGTCQLLQMSGHGGGGGGGGTKVKDIDSFSSVLTLGPLTLDHVGRYSCRASNSAATVEAGADLTVNGKVVLMLHDRRDRQD
ncbi:hypothetical protein HAZT_HAZT006499 [Hyalella azteca]|uniref:Ig-like domain-containing protein n=1 Tax=Hyalella azteca TaxID=294128 RepID=A0A6A0H4C6_HYAAZ|nr:hypothetical protein HAZT_HAZT006499 [Hyalella azteca]